MVEIIAYNRANVYVRSWYVNASPYADAMVARLRRRGYAVHVRPYMEEC